MKQLLEARKVLGAEPNPDFMIVPFGGDLNEFGQLKSD